MLRPIQPYVEYVLNQDYIVEFLCINKDKPKLQCHGKCHLAKQLKQQQNKPLTSLRVALEHYPIGFVNILRLDKASTFHLSKDMHFIYVNSYHFNYTNRVFHPPNTV